MAKIQYSWIMGAYNKQSWLAESIESILLQSNPNWELIIVDDASTDNTSELLNYYEKKDSRIRVLHNATNEGVSKVLNKATKEVRSGIVLVSAADDVYTPDRGKNAVDMLKKYKDVDVIYFPFYKCHHNLEVFEMKMAERFDEVRLKTPNGQFIGHGFMAYRKSVADAVPYRNEMKVGHDHVFMLDILKAGFKFKPADDKMIAGYYRFTPKMVSVEHRAEIVEQDKKILAEEYGVK